jgi:catechol 2,3-dioxygenase-like lactoylglutathione lyase family enzyme
MSILRVDHVGIVVDDLEAAIACFVELGMKLEGKAPIEGQSVDRLNGLDGVRVGFAMLRDPDGHGRLELTQFHAPIAVRPEPNRVHLERRGDRHVRRPERPEAAGVASQPGGCLDD